MKPRRPDIRKAQDFVAYVTLYFEILIVFIVIIALFISPVSYTHLDVYKRQVYERDDGRLRKDDFRLRQPHKIRSPGNYGCRRGRRRAGKAAVKGYI